MRAANDGEVHGDHQEAAVGVLHWRKSSYSNDIGDCVEVAELPDGAVSFRDSKDPSGPVLTFPRRQAEEFLRTLRGDLPKSVKYPNEVSPR